MMRKGYLVALLNSYWLYCNQMYVLNSMLYYMSMWILALHNYQLKNLLFMALLMNNT